MSPPASGDNAIDVVLTGTVLISTVLAGSVLTKAVMIGTALISTVLIRCTVPPHVTGFLGVSMADLTGRDNRFGT